MISDNVMKVKEFGDSVIYRVGCDCMDKDCELTLELELEKDRQMVFLNMTKDLVWDEYYHSEWKIVRAWRRLKCTLRMLFTGRIEIESSLVLKHNNMMALRDAIDEGISIMEEK